MAKNTVVGEEVYKIPETARMLCVHSDTIRRWVRTGVMPALRVGKHYQIKKSVIDSFIKSTATYPAKEE